MLAPREIPYVGSEACRRHKVSLDVQGRSMAAILAFTCHAFGLDFAIVKGAVYVDTRKGIEARVGR